MSPLNPDVLYFGTSVAVFRTTNGGQAWRQVYTRPNADGSTQTTGLELTVSRFITVDPRNPRRVFFGYSDIGLFISDDGGLTARRRVEGIPRASRHADTVLLDPGDPRHLWATFGRGDADPTGFVLAESTDEGQSWILRGEGLPDRPYRHLLLDTPGPSPRLLVTAAGNGIFASTDGGRRWFPSSAGLAHLDVRALVADPSVPGRYWAALGGQGSTPGLLYRSDDRGASWIRTSDSALEAFDIKHLAVGGSIYLAARSAVVGPRTFRGGIYASGDGGVTWRLALADRFAQAVAVDPADARMVYAGLTDHPFHDDSLGNGLRVSGDGGATWTPVTTLPTGRITALMPHPGDSRRLFVGTGGVGVILVDLNAALAPRLRRP
jgi:photosystem II stability/assembly factor-like uncharacterized protein